VIGKPKPTTKVDDIMSMVFIEEGNLGNHAHHAFSFILWQITVILGLPPEKLTEYP
jgi:hypothetical protein